MASTIPEMTSNVPDAQEHSEGESLIVPELGGTLRLTFKETAIMATSLDTLPSELHIKIVQNVDRVSSVCLGITNKKFYAIHKDLYPKVPLIAAYLSREGGMLLFGLLKEWMKKAGLFWSPSELKFITPERKAEIRSQSRKMKFVKARELLRLEVLRDEKMLGGWWENGEWVDGVERGKGRKRWVALEWNDVEWGGGENADSDLIWDL
jgi:hypothetical protein